MGLGFSRYLHKPHVGFLFIKNPIPGPAARNYRCLSSWFCRILRVETAGDPATGDVVTGVHGLLLEEVESGFAGSIAQENRASEVLTDLVTRDVDATPNSLASLSFSKNLVKGHSLGYNGPSIARVI